jgi:rubrerythrin
MRYSFFASVAKKEGYEQIAGIFNETAENEREHAKLFFTHLRGGLVEIAAAYPAGVIGTTAQNLAAAAEGEKFEWGSLYPGFASVGEEEGFPGAAGTFMQMAQVEVWHERRSRKLLANVDSEPVFSRKVEIRWKCRNCGYVHEASGAPQKCPVCAHSKAYFEVWCENY